MMTNYYKVAEHVFSVTAAESCFSLMGNYEVFAVARGETVFALTIDGDTPPLYTEEWRQTEEGQDIICGKTAEGKPVFAYRWWDETAGWLVCSPDYREGRLILTGQHTKMAIDNALMVLYALVTADRQTVLMHAAAVSHAGKGYLFLGPSGTGKSTHARLWLQHIEGTALVNDDNPIVREGVVYGSPWSGKTPCYRNVSYPLGGIVELSQAPYNRIRPLRGLQAYVALMASISGKRWDARIADGLHQTQNALASTVPVWHLECLPDAEAAQICFEECHTDLTDLTDNCRKRQEVSEKSGGLENL